MSSPTPPARLLDFEKLRETIAGIRRGAASTHLGDPRYSCIVGADHLDQMTAAIPALLDEVARLRQLALGFEEQRHTTALRNIELELALGEAVIIAKREHVIRCDAQMVEIRPETIEKLDRLSALAGAPSAVVHRDVKPGNVLS